jgi:hypothetical protein
MKSYSPTSQTNTPTHIHEKSVIKIKIQNRINQAAIRRNFAQHELQKEKANDRKQLYEASHLYLMTAKTSLIAKTTFHINMQKSSNFRR